jgi:hypothetical protein
MAGNYLRNALASVMLRATCPETHRRARPTPEHAAVCPACWLLAAEVDPGSVVRAYSLAPPQPAIDVAQPGQPFSFALTLFGDGFHFLPYFVLAVAEVGRVGLGPGRGTFGLEAIWAVDPLAGQAEQVLAPGDSLVHVPRVAVRWSGVQEVAERALSPLAGRADLQLAFLTPTRLTEAERLVRTADFAVFCQRLLLRIDQLRRQFAGEPRRPAADVARLHRLAEQARLVDMQTAWVDLKSYSGRTQTTSPMGGFVGWAVYRSADWAALLPWLILGQATQVGKLTVKGNGVYELRLPGETPYWGWLRQKAALTKAVNSFQ